MDNWKATCIASSIEVLITHPLDYVRTTRQISNKHYAFDIKHAYRGVVPRLVGVIPMRLAFWQTQYAALKATQSPVFAGIAAGICQSAVEIPFEVWKTRQMEDSRQKNNKNNNSSVVRSALRGAHYHVLRNAGFAVIVAAGHSINKQSHDDDDDKWRNIGVMSAAAIVGAVLTQPLDTLKSRAQSSMKRSQIRAIRLKTSMAGLVPRCTQCVTAITIAATTFEHYDKSV